jgi:PEP-CTERM motif
MQDIQRMTLLDHQPPAQPEFADREAWKQHLRKWGAYAAAAGAALATTTRADADIIYSGVLDITVTPPASQLFVKKVSTKSISINHHRLAARAADTLHNLPGSSFRLLSANLRGVGLGFGASFSTTASYGARNFKNALIYNVGQAIHPAATNVYAFLAGSESAATFPRRYGPIYAPGSGFVGFQTSGGDLGWVDVKLTVGPGPIAPASQDFLDQLEIISYAYNGVPGAPINAGQTSNVPEPGSLALGLLAIGASGLIAWRKCRAERQPQ